MIEALAGEKILLAAWKKMKTSKDIDAVWSGAWVSLQFICEKRVAHECQVLAAHKLTVIFLFLNQYKSFTFHINDLDLSSHFMYIFSLYKTSILAYPY